MPLNIELKDSGGTHLIAAEGEVDLYTSPELRATLMKGIPPGTKVIGVDLSRVTYMDSSGVATLIEAMKAAAHEARDFVLVSPSEAVTKVLKLTRLDSVFDIRKTL